MLQTYVNSYVLASTLLLAFMAFIWSGRVGLNLCIKLLFGAAAVCGAILAAKLWLP